MRRVLTGFLVTAILLAGGNTVHAQTKSGGRTALWTVVGAGAGFGLGLFLGLGAFDDAVNSDRKVWTSALVGAAAGGTIGYLVARPRRQAPAAPQAAMTDREIRSLAGSVSLGRLPTGARPMLQSPDAYSTAGRF
jgi:hypothetical protein